mgnify:CR=1 FL=1
MRTVTPCARTARTSVSYATAFIGFFYLLTFVLGFGAMVIVGPEAIRAIDKGGKGNAEYGERLQRYRAALGADARSVSGLNFIRFA